MTLPLGFHDLIEALPEDGCAVCRLVLAGVTSYLDGLLYEHVNTPPVHRDFRAGRGLCNTHMWQLPTFRGVSLGVAILDAAILDEMLTVSAQHLPLENQRSNLDRLLSRRSTQTEALADALEPTGPCLACRETKNLEARYLRTLIDHFDLFAEPFNQSSGLCIPHLRLALRQPATADTANRLVETQRAIWQRLKSELETFQRKSDINHVNEVMGPEGDSWIRAIGLIAGAPDALPNRTPDE